MALVTAAQLGAGAGMADPQMPGGPGAGSRPSTSVAPTLTDAPARPDKPEVEARKAYAAGMKSLDKANGFEAQARQAPNDDKKSKALAKANEAYYRALDEFTEALINKGDLAEAWNGAGLAHLRIGAYVEALDDYNHALQLRPGEMEAIGYRAEALLHQNRLEEAKSAYMDLYNHSRDRAERLMRAMQQWVIERRADPQGVKAGDLDAFAQWISERLSAAGS